MTVLNSMRKLAPFALAATLALGAASGADAAGGDSDNDGLETTLYLTNPRDPDSDDDLLSDGDEVTAHASDPNDADFDNDGLIDGSEIRSGTDLRFGDSDLDSLSDGVEVNEHGSSPVESGPVQEPIVEEPVPVEEVPVEETVPASDPAAITTFSGMDSETEVIE